VTQLPDGLQGKVLAVAIAVLTIVAVNFVVVQPLFAFYDANAQHLQDRLDIARRYRNAADDLPRLKADAQKWSEQTRNGGLLLAGGSDAVAAASLQSTLKGMVEQGGAKLTSAQTLPAEVQNNFRRVGVRVAFSGDLALLTTVLLGIETAHPVLTVSNLELHSGSDSSDGDGAGALAIAMDVYGFRAQ